MQPRTVAMRTAWRRSCALRQQNLAMRRRVEEQDRGLASSLPAIPRSCDIHAVFNFHSRVEAINKMNPKIHWIILP
jgi:hypothetical protein